MDPERYLVVDATQSVEQIHSAITTRVGELPALSRAAKVEKPKKRRAIHLPTLKKRK